MNKTPKTVERQPLTGQSRRTFLTGSTSLGLILAAGEQKDVSVFEGERVKSGGDFC